MRDCTRRCETAREYAKPEIVRDCARLHDTVQDSTRACKSMRDRASIQRQLIIEIFQSLVTQQAAGDVNFLVHKTNRHVTL